MPSANRTRTTLAAASLTLTSTLGFCFLSYAEHTRAVRPASLLNTYLLVTVLFDIANTRTLWLRAADHLNHVIAYIATTAVVLKSIILVLEALDKRHLLRPEYRAYPPEATSSIYHRSLFWWLNPLFRQGYGHELVVDDLFVLDKHIRASYCYKRFRGAWSSG
jgi:ATP-binding cassette, subfamily C (CFTR/MRP), member 1